MNKSRYIFFTGVLIMMVILSGFIVKPSGVLKSMSERMFSDTTSFAANTSGGWGILSSYLNEDTPNNVRLELILKRSGRIGKTDQLIGTITNMNFRPSKNQTVNYYLLGDNVWILRINTNGECYLKQDRGSALKPTALAGNPDVIPINIRYKKD